mgnify:CR=1 FL=1
MSCADVQTIQAGDGSKVLFSFDFPYIFKSEIHVYLWNTTTKEWDEKLTTDATYPWQITDANPTIVEFTSTAPPTPTLEGDDPNETLVDNVRIKRITNVDDIRALFNPGSAIRSDDLNKNFEQLRYAIQEANCQGIPDDIDQYLKDYYWDRYDNTIYSADTWVSDDTKIATTLAMDQRFQDEVNDTFTKAELASASDVMPDNDDAVPTTGTVKDYIDHVVETDILVDGTGLNKTGSGGQVTIGISAGSVDLDRIKAEDIITSAEQDADYDLTGDDDSVFTSLAAVRRFENYVQNTAPTTTGIGKGRVWVDVDDDLTLSVWNGSSWLGITSGGTFTNQPKVVYVDASSGDDANDGHRISRPKATIKAAINQINGDSTYGDGSVVIVAAGVYQEAAPIQIQKKNVSIIGQALRSCIVHPTVATQGDQSAGNHALFELNSGSYIANLTLTGMQANTGTGNSVDSTLPTNQGWNFAFYSGATITKSPYIQNCTNFSDSEIDNSNLNANTPAGGLAGDTDSLPTGGGLLVDGSAVDSASPLRSIVCDSYTHVGLNGPGILVTNNGYVQATSSYAFFNKYHIKTLNGGQANLAASTTDFGDQALVADGKSTTNIFTANCVTQANVNDTTIEVSNGVADASWHGTKTRPATNMLLAVNSEAQIYPILGAVPTDTATYNADPDAYTGNWTVTISRPDPNNKSSNLGFSAQVSTGTNNVQFFLRSMIASSGHTMEYVGSGTDYRALPENGGVPDETKQITESFNGKVWTAITDHNGKFKIGGNQTDDPIFQVDQQLGFVTIPEGSIAFNLLSDLTPQLGGNLDVNGNEITSASNGDIVLNPNGTGVIRIDKALDGNTTGSLGDSYLTVHADDLHVRGDIPANTALSTSSTLTVGREDNGSGADHMSFSYTSGESPTNPGQATFGSAGAIWTSNGDFDIIAGLGSPTTDPNNNTFYENIGFHVRNDGGTTVNPVTIQGFHTGTEVVFNDTTAIRVPVGTTAQRPSGGNGPGAVTGQLRFNSTVSQFEGYNGTSWASVGGGATGGGADQWAVEHDNTITTSYTITSNKNVISAGPLTVNAGVTVTVPSGSNWVIV